jgi:hypothetical protein
MLALRSAHITTVSDTGAQSTLYLTRKLHLYVSCMLNMNSIKMKEIRGCSASRSLHTCTHSEVQARLSHTNI